MANKIDLTGSGEALRKFRQAVEGEVLGISAATGKGLRRLSERIWQALHPS